MGRQLLVGGSVVVVGLGSLALASPAAADCPEGTFASNFGEVCSGGPSFSTPPAPPLVIPRTVSGSPGSPFLFVAGMACNSARWANCMAWIQNPSP